MAKYGMQADPLFEAFLLEHNVVNREAIAAYCERFAILCDNENAKLWFTKTLANHLEKDEHINVPMTDNNRPRQPIPWLDAAIERGDDLRVFKAPTDLDPTFEHLADYFNHLSEHDPRIFTNVNRTLAVTVPAAIKRSEDWVKQMHSEASQTAVEGVEELMRDGPYRWVRGVTTAALHRDGAILGNCLAHGNYDETVMNGSQRVVFLHDSKGQPHVAMRFKSPWQLVECKGKQNKAPVGRYITLVKNFLNSDLMISQGLGYDPSGIAEVKRMGLIYDPSTHKVGAITDEGEVIWNYAGGAVRVIKVTAKEVRERGHGAFPAARVTEDGVDFWFNTTNDGDIMRLNLSSNGLLKLVSLPDTINHDQLREIVQGFLNEHFQDAPAPVRNASYGAASNQLPNLNLHYNYTTKRYGSVEEVGEQVFAVGKVVFYKMGVLGEGSKLNDRYYAVDPAADEDGIPFYFDATDKLLKIGGQDISDPALRKTIIAGLNKLGLPLGGSRETTKLDEVGAYYNDGKYGPLDSIGTKVWEKGSRRCFKWNDHDKEDYLFCEGKADKDLFSLANEDGKVFVHKHQTRYERSTVTREATSPEVIHDFLVAALNESPAFEGWENLDYDLDKYNVFYGNGKWGTLAEVGKVFHQFDDGVKFVCVKRGENLTFQLLDASGNKSFTLTFEDNKPVMFVEAKYDKMAAGPYLLWLLNGMKAGEMDTLDSKLNGYRESNNVKPLLWHHGLFFDSRTGKWKTIQSGKVVFKGSNFRAVNFRNRIFIVAPNEGIIGYFKKEGSTIKNRTVFEPFGMKDMLDCLRELCANTEYRLPYRGQTGAPGLGAYNGGDEYTHQRLRNAGHYMKGNELRSIEEDFPSEEIMKLSNGMVWHRRAHEDAHHGDENTEAIHNERFTLEDKSGEHVMRVSFDDGYLKSHTYYVPNKFHKYNDRAHSMRGMPKDEKKYLIALMEKLGFKVSPTMALEFGYYRDKNGKFKSITSNKALSGFLKGEIKFPDGHVFLRQGQGEWNLGVIDENAEHSWDRLKTYIKVQLDDEGLESVRYLKKNVKRNPKEYMPYIHKLLQTFSIISGEGD